jgi:ABC-type uncharacterized transport system permease subunit
MEQLLGTSLPVYIGVVVIIIGFAAFMTGQALANTWKRSWQVLVSCILLAFASRFLVFALYEGELLSISGYLIDAVVLSVIGLFAFFLTRARRMVRQYPWLYERTGMFGWRSRQRSGRHSPPRSPPA